MTTQTLPRLSFAPLEGITGWVFRQVHQRRFPGLDRYYAPFFAPTTDSPLTGRGLTDLQPDHNQGVPVVPQLLANQAEAFLAATRVLQDLGYAEVNLNLGCPSGTVVAKGKGAGFLAHPMAGRLPDRHLLPNRPGHLHQKPGSGWRMRQVARPAGHFRRYPIRELIIHPPSAGTFYRGPGVRGPFSMPWTTATSPCVVTMGTSLPPGLPGAGRPVPPPSPTGWQAGGVYNPALGRQLQGANP